MSEIALLVGASAAAGFATYFLTPTHGKAGMKLKTVQEAHRDLSKNIDSTQLEKSGNLSAIFKDSGWSNSVDVRDGKVMDWCGMAVAAWSWRAGLLPVHRRSFWATSNVRSFFSYATKGAHNRTLRELNGKPIQEVHAAAGSLRKWLETHELRAVPLKSLDIEPGDVVLIAHRGQTTGADHIALVESFDGRKLITVEGNASGTLPNGKAVRSGVVRKSRDLSDVQIRATLFGVGRFSKLDFA